MVPSPGDFSCYLTCRPSTRGLTHLLLHRPWLQVLLRLGLAQHLGILVITFSRVASSVTTPESVKRSCPSLGAEGPSRTCLLLSVCRLTTCAAIICPLSAVVCCIQIFSWDLMHTLIAFSPFFPTLLGRRLLLFVQSRLFYYKVI
uniref:Uncharacterized protein n=1 Tax=Prolemur simus TaxID=1328070 RepID=A0A8C9A458_PROSS